MIQIDKVKHPLPDGVSAETRKKYPFEKMKVEESFTFEKKKIASVQACASIYMKNTGGKRKFIARAVSSTEGRCWRIK